MGLHYPCKLEPVSDVFLNGSHPYKVEGHRDYYHSQMKGEALEGALVWGRQEVA